MRKSIIVSIIACLWLVIGTSGANGQTTTFNDIKGSFAEASINQLAEQGMIHGITPGQFGPRLRLSRLQFAILTARVLGVQPVFPSQPTFTDLTPGTLETGYVEALACLGIVKGAKGSQFRGGSPVSREAAAVMLWRAMGQAEAGSVVICQDTQAVSSYAAPGVAWVMSEGLMNGNSGRFLPKNYLTREEAAVIVLRLLKMRTEQATKVVLPEEDSVELGVGASKDLSQKQIYPAGFSMVYGTDSSNFAVDTVNSRLLGLGSGSGTLTQNCGSKHYLSTVKAAAANNNANNQSELDEAIKSSPLPFTYRVSEQSPDISFRQIEYKNYSGPVDGLTSRGEAWTGFLRQQGRDIIVDLGRLRPVNSCSLEFKQDASAGIYFPQYLEGSVSVDGSSWYYLGQAGHQVDPNDKTVPTMKLSLAFPPVNVRYIKLNFPVNVYVFTRHLTVNEGMPAAEPAVLAPITGSGSAEEGYLSTTAFKDVLLVFTGDATDIKTLNSDDFLPLVTHVSPGGKPAGRMFDTIQFMPYTGMPCTKAGWTAYLNDLFTSGQQLSALEAAMAKSGLSTKEKVVLALPYPDSQQTDFGTLDSSGILMSFSPDADNPQASLKNRLSAVQWYYNELMQRWNLAGFKYLELTGIYWYKETMDPRIEGEIELVQSTARMVKANGQNFIWMPYYGANGLAEWKTYGFTHVFLQPNYYATQDPPADRMDQAAALAKKYNTAMELELDNRILSTRYYYDLFYNELNKAHAQGLDGNTPNAYYVGFAQTLINMVKSDVPLIRKVYDDLYLWINGKFT
ncbi:MAG: DUF4855 domain-containing protein [Methylocystaceae bacterium]